MNKKSIKIILMALLLSSTGVSHGGRRKIAAAQQSVSQVSRLLNDANKVQEEFETWFSKQEEGLKDATRAGDIEEEWKKQVEYRATLSEIGSLDNAKSEIEKKMAELVSKNDGLHNRLGLLDDFFEAQNKRGMGLAEGTSEELELTKRRENSESFVAEIAEINNRSIKESIQKAMDANQEKLASLYEQRRVLKKDIKKLQAQEKRLFPEFDEQLNTNLTADLVKKYKKNHKQELKSRAEEEEEKSQQDMMRTGGTRRFYEGN